MFHAYSIEKANPKMQLNIIYIIYFVRWHLERAPSKMNKIKIIKTVKFEAIIINFANKKCFFKPKFLCYSNESDTLVLKPNVL